MGEKKVRSFYKLVKVKVSMEKLKPRDLFMPLKETFFSGKEIMECRSKPKKNKKGVLEIRFVKVGVQI